MFVATPQLLFAARLFSPFAVLIAIAGDTAVKGIGVIGEQRRQGGVLDVSSSGWFLLGISVVVLLLFYNWRCGLSRLLPAALEQ
jgi:hypothetical protein